MNYLASIADIKQRQRETGILISIFFWREKEFKKPGPMSLSSIAYAKSVILSSNQVFLKAWCHRRRWHAHRSIHSWNVFAGDGDYCCMDHTFVPLDSSAHHGHGNKNIEPPCLVYNNSWLYDINAYTLPLSDPPPSLSHTHTLSLHPKD